MKLQVMARSGRMQYSWMNAQAIRSKLWPSQVCDDRDGPYTKIR